MNKEKINILYLRKSSEDKNSQIQSIEDQQIVMHKLADKLNICIDRTFIDEKSARFPFERAGFDELKELVYQGGVESILCWKMDRLSRNMLEAGIVMDFLQRGYLTSVITPDKVFDAMDNVLIATVEFGIANEEIKKLSQNVRRGLARKNAKGIMPSKAPIGYINEIYAPKGAKRILPDPEKFDKVRLIWDKALEKRYTLNYLAEYADSIGLKALRSTIFSKNTIWGILKNTFYYGEYTYGGKIYQGIHKKMISKEEFDLIQKMYFSDRESNNKHSNHYNCLFRCGECGYMISPEPPKFKKIKATGEIRCYKYWRCTHKSKQINCTQRSLREHLLEKQIESNLVSLNLTREHIKLIKVLISESCQQLSEINTITNYVKLYMADTNNTSEALKKIYADLNYCENIVEKFNNGLSALRRDILCSIFIERILINKELKMKKYLRFEYISKLKSLVEGN